MGGDIPHHDVDVDEIQTLDIYKLVEHKAKVAYQQLQTPVLVEDVQFIMHALGSLPGPFIKYFVSADDGVANMCRMLNGFTNRQAVASCVFGYYDGTTLEFFTGEIHGEVARTPAGEGGYGFDRVFIPAGFDGRTAGELSEEEYSVYYSTIKPFVKVEKFLKED